MRSTRARDRSRLAQLRSIDLFADCTDEELRVVDGLGVQIRLDKGTQLIGEGAAARECYVVLEGTVAVTSAGSPVATLGRGSIVGETALISGRPRNATVEALTSLSVILLHHAEFARLMRIPTVAAKVRRASTTRTHAASGHAVDHDTGTLPRRQGPPAVASPARSIERQRRPASRRSS